jgi:hypothetical protein
MQNIYSKDGFVKTYLQGRTIIVIWEKLYDADEIYSIKFLGLSILVIEFFIDI